MKEESTKVSLSDVEAMSDEESDYEEGDAEEWNAEAQALRQAISEGAFDALAKLDIAKNLEEEEDEEDEEDDDVPIVSSSTDSTIIINNNNNNSKALNNRTLTLESERSNVPWMESMQVVLTEQPLPFETDPLSVHDDLKREVAFYNVALASVQEAKLKFQNANVPFHRPTDFFAEMIKTDSHMAKIKDRLIFEGKKIAAFEQRKSNREQKLRIKEKRNKKLEEKVKEKKEHFKSVDNWAKSAAQNRLGNNKVRDDDEMDQHFNNKKNEKKFGFGGKRPRFKQNDPKSLNDMSDYNPRGNFGGIGTKGGGGGNNKRVGKRARDAKRSR